MTVLSEQVIERCRKALEDGAEAAREALSNVVNLSVTLGELGLEHYVAELDAIASDLESDIDDLDDDYDSICAACSGTGEGSADGARCSYCRGTGEVPREAQEP